jgi:hypothetical protein
MCTLPFGTRLFLRFGPKIDKGEHQSNQPKKNEEANETGSRDLLRMVDIPVEMCGNYTFCMV